MSVPGRCCATTDRCVPDGTQGRPHLAQLLQHVYTAVGTLPFTMAYPLRGSSSRGDHRNVLLPGRDHPDVHHRRQAGLYGSRDGVPRVDTTWSSAGRFSSNSPKTVRERPPGGSRRVAHRVEDRPAVVDPKSPCSLFYGIQPGTASSRRSWPDAVASDPDLPAARHVEAGDAAAAADTGDFEEGVLAMLRIKYAVIVVAIAPRHAYPFLSATS